MGPPQSPLDFVGRGKIYAVFVILLLAKESEHGIYLDESPVSRTKKNRHHLVSIFFAMICMLFSAVMFNLCYYNCNLTNFVNK